tara:strand:- start:25811 stop:27439 length:1629 start_codon:yes stop_codon:yes gene_type:complete
MKKKITKTFISMVILLMLLGCKDQKKSNSEKLNANQSSMIQNNEEAMYRPNYHFSPKKGWMNDPNGMFFYNGYYHLYFQHYPDDNKWGPMHWGHATSTDMITWKEQPIALYPDELGYIFSGSAVVDIANTSGFGKDGKVPIVAMFTYHDMKKEKAKKTDVESQAIAFSLDEGLTWTKYEGNPVIANPGIRDFRDPKVSWDAIHNKWVMVLAAQNKTMFYGSKDLKTWELLSDFGGNFDKAIGTHGGVWECPDLFPLPVEGTDEVKWVHLVSINPGGPNGGSATQYFIGDFDGTTFTMDDDFEAKLLDDHDFWIDFGKDNYAGVTFSNLSSGKGGKFLMGWMSNWEYANIVPTEAWRSAMTISREIKLIESEKSYRIAFKPVYELNGYKGLKFKKENVEVSEKLEIITSKEINLSSAEIKFNISDLKNHGFTFSLSNSIGDELLFGFDAETNNYYIDRKKSGKVNFEKRFADKISIAPRISTQQNIEGIILLDKTSIELFFDEGASVMTEIFFTNAPFEMLSIVSTNQNFKLDYIEVNQLTQK